MPSAGVSSVPSVSVIGCSALNVLKQYHGRASLAGPAFTAHRAPVQDHEVAGLDVCHALADGLDRASGLVAEQERELVVDAALTVGQVCVADAACDDVDDDLARSGIGDDDIHHLDRFTLLP